MIAEIRYELAVHSWPLHISFFTKLIAKENFPYLKLMGVSALSLRTINLNELEDQPLEVREAIAFYAAHALLPIHFTSEDRARHYSILENAGYIEKL